MIVHFQCPKCQAGLKAPEDKIGARSKCRRCGSPVQVPDPDIAVVASAVPFLPEQQDNTLEHESMHRDREPWFYRHLESYAKSLQFLANFIAVVCLVFSTFGFAMFLVVMKEGNKLDVRSVFGACIGWVLSLAVIASARFLELVVVAAILLAVDAARNIRAMKKATETAPFPR